MRFENVLEQNLGQILLDCFFVKTQFFHIFSPTTSPFWGLFSSFLTFLKNLASLLGFDDSFDHVLFFFESGMKFNEQRPLHVLITPPSKTVFSHQKSFFRTFLKPCFLYHYIQPKSLSCLCVEGLKRDNPSVLSQVVSHSQRLFFFL